MNIEEFDIDDWPDCPMSGCQNKTCLSLNSDKCWPHTGSGKLPSEIMTELNKELVGEVS
jgi:hypothetical protein